MKSKPEHVELTARLADLLLKEYEKRLIDGSISDTGMANLQRLLKDNGWVIEDEALNSIREKLTKTIDPSQFDDDDEAVVGKIA
jgi:hypothetical protein